MKRTMILVIMMVSLISASEQYFKSIGDFPLDNGGCVKSCRIGYRIIGALSDTGKKLVVFPTWYGGTSEHVEGLIKKYNYIDTTAYTIVVLDAIGNGISSSPTNSKIQLNQKFPQITIHDMVRAQYLLLTEYLNIDHIHAVVGGSMGGMQVYEWIVTYPSFMDKAVPYVSTPSMTSFDMLQHEFQLRLIREARKVGIPESRLMMLLDMAKDISAKTPGYVAENINREEFDKYLEKFMPRENRLFNSWNWECQLEAMRYHDIGKHFENGMEEAMDAINTELLIIVNRQDHLVNPMPAIRLAEQMHAETLILDNTSGHLGVTPEINRVKNAINTFLGK